MNTASMTVIATTPSFRKRSGVAPASSLPSVTHEPMISSSRATRPDGSSGAAIATASSGTTPIAIHGRAPWAAQPSASAHPGGTSSSAIQVITSALVLTAAIATTLTTTDTGPMSAQPRPLSRSRNAGRPAAGRPTQTACAASSTKVSGFEVHAAPGRAPFYARR